MRLRNAASMPRVRTRQPDTARTAFTDHIARHQRASMQHSQSPARNLSLRGAPFDSALDSSLATSYRIVEHHFRAIYAPFPSATHHSVTSIPGSTGRPLQHYPYKGLVTAASTQRVQACVLTQCVQLCDHSWYTCERLRIATFTRACFHTPLRKRASTTQPLCRAVWRNLTATVFLLSLLVLSGFVGFIHD